MKIKNTKCQTSKTLSRRKFIRQSAMGAVGLTISGSLISELDAFASTPDISRKSKVILVRHSKVIDPTGKIQWPLLQEMLDKAITALTDTSSLADAWRQFFSPEDIIGLKINANSLRDFRETDWIDHYPALASAIISGCKKAGIEASKFVIWDRSEEEVADAGFSAHKEFENVRLMGTKKKKREPEGLGFSEKSYPVGEKSTHVSKLITEICTAMINVPVLKDHGLSGVTGCMKNHYGSIDNPREFHENACTKPGIPEINAIPAIRDKERLCIADALLCAYNGGPRWKRDYFWTYGGIVVGTDPVAVDSVLLQLLDEKREAEEMQRIKPMASHLTLAETQGLGLSDSEKIDLIKMELS
jgi:uncharacterized protein (DUF362 family)